VKPLRFRGVATNGGEDPEEEPDPQPGLGGAEGGAEVPGLGAGHGGAACREAGGRLRSGRYQFSNLFKRSVHEPYCSAVPAPVCVAGSISQPSARTLAAEERRTRMRLHIEMAMQPAVGAFSLSS